MHETALKKMSWESLLTKDHYKNAIKHALANEDVALTTYISILPEDWENHTQG